MSTLPGYEKKSADFIRLCAESKANGVTHVTIAYPWALGDTYAELIESLSRLADAGLHLHIAARKDWPGQNQPGTGLITSAVWPNRAFAAIEERFGLSKKPKP
jgi:hypothetical protein